MSSLSENDLLAAHGSLQDITETWNQQVDCLHKFRFSSCRVPHHSVVLHVAGGAHGLVVLHDVRLPGEDTVTVKAAEVLQMPVLILGLRVLVTEDQL